VVAYDHETHRAHIRNDENGVLVPHRDVRAAVAALCALINDPERRGRLAAAARQYVTANFSFEKMYDVMNDGFRRALACRK
jgi:glycosyltransferase involved in cell wall biosynthesis